MIILALDCAGGGCGVCVTQGNVVLALTEERMDRGQDSRLVPLIEETLAQAGVTYADLDRIAVTRGPGSFTGLRIALACARALGLAAGKPVIGIDRFVIQAAQHKGQSPLLIALESRRLELYVRLDQNAPALWPPQEIAALLKTHPALKIAGDAQETLRPLIGRSAFVGLQEPEVLTCATLAALADPADAAFAPRPLYLRAPDVTIKACEAL